ncbi:uncharacterized protein BT62DRAFT_619926 [Guyanagaster necrorhizus]|uniref:F-box domain-containing protein n=1 Tax=Guyanagaster necrorhizus TaxID=856835 RepID=A0A9P7VZV3_9AGAR|nr:uncharacterized protein BT62DRAFT_619926 [Guyanagaster necrorhizus MCA 3950]KAG7450017.1 hypothetical protein BT62DRAFT_619926 [Guyanagaster necrorhizus MCA 3950]
MPVKAVAHSEHQLELASCSLARIPTELLAIIVSYLGKKDLFSAALVCRRLNDITTAVWFGPPKQYQKTYGAFSSSHVGHALPFSSFKDLRLCLVTKPTIPNIKLSLSKDFARDFREFLRYFDTLPGDNAPPDVQIDLHHTVWTRSNVRDADEYDAERLNAFFTRIAELNCVTALHTCTESEPWLDFKGEDCLPIFSPPALTTLTEEYLKPLSESYSDWLIRSANVSPVNKLVIAYPDGSILLRLHLPKLRDALFNGGKISTHHLSLFLGQEAHSRLEELIFAPNTILCHGMPDEGHPKCHTVMQLRPGALPRLTSVAADTDVLALLLSAPHAFTGLQRVDVRLPYYRGPSIGRDLRRVFSWVSQIPSVLRMTLPLEDLAYNDWEYLSLESGEDPIVLPHVRKLVCGGYPRYDWSIRLDQIVVFFPGVEEFVMDRASWKEPRRLGCVEQMKEQWPSLKRVVIDGVRYSNGE